MPQTAAGRPGGGVAGEPGEGTADTVVTLPGACEDAADSLTEATRLIDDVAGAVRDFRPDELVGLLDQLEDLDAQVRSQTAECSRVDVSESASPEPTTARVRRCVDPAAAGGARYRGDHRGLRRCAGDDSSTRGGRTSPLLGRGLLLVCVAGILWGTIGPAVPLAVEASGLSPLTVGALRGLVAAAVLLAAAASFGRLRDCWVLARPQWRRVVAVGALTATFQQLFFVAVLWAGVSITTVVCLGFAPALLLVVGSVRERRPPAAGPLATVTVAVVGLLLVGLAGGDGATGSRPVVGVLAALAAGAAYGFSAEVGAPLSRRLDTLTITTATMVVTAGVLLPLGLGLPLLQGEPVLTTDLGVVGVDRRPGRGDDGGRLRPAVHRAAHHRQRHRGGGQPARAGDRGAAGGGVPR